MVSKDVKKPLTKHSSMQRHRESANTSISPLGVVWGGGGTNYGAKEAAANILEMLHPFPPKHAASFCDMQLSVKN